MIFVTIMATIGGISALLVGAVIALELYISDAERSGKNLFQ